MNILLAVDNSPHSQVAVDVVLSRTWPEDTTFKVFCAVERRQPIFAVMERGEAEAFLNKALTAAKEFTREIAEQLTEHFPGCKALAEAQFGDSKEMILDASKWADLIVVGSHGRHGVARLFLGSVSQNILLHGHCSTLIARYQHAHTGRPSFDNNILVALDDTTDSKNAMDWILKLPWNDDARFTLLTVIAVPDDIQASGVDALYAQAESIEIDRLKESATLMLEDYANQLEEKIGIGKVSIELREGQPVDSILSMAAATKAGLIVMGSRQRGHLMRFFMGSVSQEVVLHAPCPVEVVKQVNI
ncbi:MAG: universal stress protein [Candidatus Obscuribacterales bacterium]